MRSNGHSVSTSLEQLYQTVNTTTNKQVLWRRLCTSFGTVSDGLCNALALLARRLCTEVLDFNSLQAYVACRLVPLDKRPGVRPIGICEVARRIISKAIFTVIGGDIQQAVGTLQLCAGQAAGIEAAIHAMRHIYEDDNTEALLLVAAENTFNILNLLCQSYSRIPMEEHQISMRDLGLG